MSSLGKTFAYNIIILLILIFSVNYDLLAESQQNLSSLFYHANAYYDSNDFEQAIEIYEQILDTGYTNGNLYYNLANAYYRLGKKGYALLNYERAMELMPRDPDLRSNLEYLQKELNLVDKKQSLLSLIADRLSMHELGNLVTILLIIMMILCLLRLFFQTLKKPLQASFYLIILFLVLAIVVMGLRLNEIYQTNPAIVVVSEAHAHFEPSVSGEVHYKLREGERVDIKGEYDGWVAVERWDGKKGYLKETEIIPIRVEKKE